MCLVKAHVSQASWWCHISPGVNLTVSSYRILVLPVRKKNLHAFVSMFLSFNSLVGLEGISAVN